MMDFCWCHHWTGYRISVPSKYRNYSYL